MRIPFKKHGVAVAKEAIALFDGMLVRVAHLIQADEGGHQLKPELDVAFDAPSPMDIDDLLVVDRVSRRLMLRAGSAVALQADLLDVAVLPGLVAQVVAARPVGPVGPSSRQASSWIG